jgi:hypothetical protein
VHVLNPCPTSWATSCTPRCWHTTRTHCTQPRHKTTPVLGACRPHSPGKHTTTVLVCWSTSGHQLWQTWGAETDFKPSSVLIASQTLLLLQSLQVHVQRCTRMHQKPTHPHNNPALCPSSLTLHSALKHLRRHSQPIAAVPRQGPQHAMHHRPPVLNSISGDTQHKQPTLEGKL